MTSLAYSIAQLKAAQTYLYQIGGPFIILLGTMGSILNLLVFTQKNLRKNPCSIYFIAYNLSNLVYIYAVTFALTLHVGYQMDPSIYNLPLCRLRLYISLVSNCLSPYYLILASIDRILITSSKALTRQKSTRRLAYLCICVGTLFWALFHCHALIRTNILRLAPNILVCYYELGTYFTFISYFLIIKELLALSSMIFCGLWSIKNIRSTRRIVVAHNLAANRTLSKDRQLMFMILIDSSIYVLFSFFYGSSLMYSQITQNYRKSYDQVQIESVVQYLCLYSIGIPFCTSCYTNLIVSKTFRKEVQKVLPWRRIFCMA